MKNQPCTIRPLLPEETHLLSDFLYEAIYLPEGTPPPPRSVILLPELQVYIRDFGTQPDDHCLVAEASGQVVGALWVRQMNDYGHVDAHTPSLAISLYKDFRGHGIGTRLMKGMLDLLHGKSYRQVSLSVQKANPAVPENEITFVTERKKFSEKDRSEASERIGKYPAVVTLDGILVHTLENQLSVFMTDTNQEDFFQ